MNNTQIKAGINEFKSEVGQLQLSILRANRVLPRHQAWNHEIWIKSEYLRYETFGLDAADRVAATKVIKATQSELARTLFGRI